MLKARLLEYWEGIAYPFGEPELTSGFSGARVAQSLVFCVVFCSSLFVLLSVYHCVVCPSIYGFWLPLCIFKHFLVTISSMQGVNHPHSLLYCLNFQGNKCERERIINIQGNSWIYHYFWGNKNASSLNCFIVDNSTTHWTLTSSTFSAKSLSSTNV
jgi:hypothetical protein